MLYKCHVNGNFVSDGPITTLSLSQKCGELFLLKLIIVISSKILNLKVDLWMFKTNFVHFIDRFKYVTGSDRPNFLIGGLISLGLLNLS